MSEMGGCAHETLRTAVFLILNFKLTLGNTFFFLSLFQKILILTVDHCE